jgi:hypothetical protein
MFLKYVKKSISLFKILPFFFLFLFVAFPHLQENLHVIFVHQEEIIHSHEPDGTVHYHTQKQRGSSGKSEPDQHQHSFKEFFLIFVRSGVSPTPSSFNNDLPVVVIAFELWSNLFEQPVLNLKSGSYRGPPDQIHFACQEIVLSHPNKAPPLA